ncbi:MAG: oxygenase MpaB family protein [Thermoleophilaceae bacterium]
MATSILPREDELEDLVPREGSILWRKAGDSRILSGAGYALLLQVSHPTVGAGVDQHSDFAADPWGRLLRTLDYVHGTVYGGPRLAGEIGRRVRNLHKDIKGSKPDGQPYHALEPEAYAWVHATLASSIVDGHRLLGAALSPAEAEDFWQEWRRLGRLVGVRYGDLPEHWAGFRPYFDRVVEEELEDTRMVHVVFDTLAEPAPPEIPGLHPALWKALRHPMGRSMQLVTAGLLPPVLRERFGFEWTLGQERMLRVLSRASRASGPLMRGPLRQFGPYYVRWRRAALERGDVASSHIAAKLRAKAHGAA